MRLEQLQYIVEIDKTKSISKAAKNLYITQPSISAAISALEKELNIKIFERNKNGVEPTPEGERIVFLAREVLSKTQEIYTVKNDDTANIEVMTIPAINSGILGQVFSSWRKKHEKGSLQIKECKVDTVLSDFFECYQLRKRYFCLCSITDEAYKLLRQHLELSHIQSEFLAEDYMVCLMSVNNPLASEESISKKMFIEQPRIKYEYGSPKISTDISSNIAFYDDFVELYSGDIKLEVSTLETLRQMVAEDVGLTVMPAIIVNNDMYFRDGKIKITPFNDTQIKLNYYLLYNKDYPLTEIEQDFIKMMKDELKAWEKSSDNKKIKAALKNI